MGVDDLVRGTIKMILHLFDAKVVKYTIAQLDMCFYNSTFLFYLTQ